MILLKLSKNFRHLKILLLLLYSTNIIVISDNKVFNMFAWYN
jgi:hypothetical protein